jgi:hypothetical protein
VTLRGIDPGDIVRCQVDGQAWHAYVDCRAVDRGLAVRPIEPDMPVRRVTARQLVGHWRASKKNPV